MFRLDVTIGKDLPQESQTQRARSKRNHGRPTVRMTQETVATMDPLGHEPSSLQGFDEFFSRRARQGAHAAIVTL
jgi:hypothetical protein